MKLKKSQIITNKKKSRILVNLQNESYVWKVETITYKARRCRSSHRKNSEKAVLKSFSKFMRKHLCPKVCDFIKKETATQALSCKFCDICKNAFFTEHLQATACGGSGQNQTSNEHSKKKSGTSSA